MILIDMKYINENSENEKYGILLKEFKYCCINYYFGKDKIIILNII
jgi:hypothetical protein